MGLRAQNTRPGPLSQVLRRLSVGDAVPVQRRAVGWRLTALQNNPRTLLMLWRLHRGKVQQSLCAICPTSHPGCCGKDRGFLSNRSADVRISRIPPGIIFGMWSNTPPPPNVYIVPIWSRMAQELPGGHPGRGGDPVPRQRPSLLSDISLTKSGGRYIRLHIILYGPQVADETQKHV